MVDCANDVSQISKFGQIIPINVLPNFAMINVRVLVWSAPESTDFGNFAALHAYLFCDDVEALQATYR